MRAMVDSTMLLEVSILTICIIVGGLIWAYIDTKQEKKLLDAIEAEHRSGN